jgi:aryl-alcohol dehydrogenase-like predicted oxidoreductase
MEERSLGRSGLRVSVVGLGCMNFGMFNDQAQASAVVKRALELGVNLFDVADVYGNRGTAEQMLGEALGEERRNVIVATKFAGPMSGEQAWMQGGSRRWIMQAVEGSLRRLGTDYIDLYQMHRADTEVPVEESLRALDDLVRQGKVRYIGCSNYAAWQIADAAWTSRVHHLNAFISVQNRYSVMTRDLEREVAPAVAAHGLGVIPYFPLESGLLSGKYVPGRDFPADSRLAKWGKFATGAFASPDKLEKVGKLFTLCERYDHTLLQLAMGWLAAKPYVSSIIAGVTRPQQLEQNVAAAAWRGSAEEMAEIDSICPPPEPAFAGMGPRR